VGRSTSHLLLLEVSCPSVSQAAANNGIALWDTEAIRWFVEELAPFEVAVGERSSRKRVGVPR
jgi:hypothetical protein